MDTENILLELIWHGKKHALNPMPKKVNRKETVEINKGMKPVSDRSVNTIKYIFKLKKWICKNSQRRNNFVHSLITNSKNRHFHTTITFFYTLFRFF